jgi:NCAIR mutase (PurE)-related protein
MNKSDLTKLLQNVRAGTLDVESALNRLKHLPFEDVVYAHIDHHRHLRHGMPEVIYCEGKTLEQVVGIARRMLAAKSDILAPGRTSGFIRRSKDSTAAPFITRPPALS